MEKKVLGLSYDELLYKWDYGYSSPPAFAPFELNGVEMALYPPTYHSLGVMHLPSCSELGSVKDGFCVVDIYIPKKEGGEFYPLAFVYGCHWACPYEIKVVDISKAEQGILEYRDLVDYKGNYADGDLPANLKLDKGVDMSYYDDDGIVTVVYDRLMRIK